ncbi:ribose import binding protein RbsB [Lachnospiraceae bacterium]|nr:ribose import binding protein RbsB [Lachnospiraceae bacterium]
MKRKLTAVLLTVVMAAAMAGCGGSKESSNAPAPAEGEKEEAAPAEAEEAAENVADAAEGSEGAYKVAFLCKSFTDTFCLSVKEQFEEAAKGYADKFTVDYFDSENTAATQNDQIETCTAAGYDAIVFQQVDAEASVEVVKAALDKGIYVVVTTGHIEDNGASWYVDADPYQQGQVVVDYAIEQGFCDDAEVAILSGPTGNFHSENRVKAFKDAIEAKEGATLVATEVAEWSKDNAMTVAQNWLVAYPDLKVILAANDDMGMGAVEAIEMAGKEDQVKVFAIDGTEGGLQAVSEGRLGATVKQDEKGYAVEAIKIVDALLSGSEAESLNIDSTLVTKDNVADFQ